MKRLKIALLCGPENGSPRVLAETLNALLRDKGLETEVYYRVKALKRLHASRDVQYNRISWSFYKVKNYFGDLVFFKKIKKTDAIIICDWTPNGFYNYTYNIKRFREIIKNVPILYYAVQYLNNSPTIINKLKESNHPLIERYDWHLSVSAVTEISSVPQPPWSQIGMNLFSTGLKPYPKSEFKVVVDFLRPGYEKYRNIQIEVLTELEISYISLEKEYSLNDIREIYRESAVFFIQFPEAFGLPIAECLACGSYIGTPDNSWPMSWRLNENPEIHGPGELPNCFLVYNDADDLKKKLIKLRAEFDLEKSPEEVFNTFIQNYGTFYYGNSKAIDEVIKKIENDDFARI